MKRIYSIEELCNVIQEGNTDFFVAQGSIHSSKSIDFTKRDLSQLSVYHEIDEREEFINLNRWEDSSLYGYINDGLLYMY